MADHYVELPQLCSYAFALNHDYIPYSPLTYVSTACEISKRLVSQIMGLFLIHPCAFKHDTCTPTKNCPKRFVYQRMNITPRIRRYEPYIQMYIIAAD
jgi:hypothetical protein